MATQGRGDGNARQGATTNSPFGTCAPCPSSTYKSSSEKEPLPACRALLILTFQALATTSTNAPACQAIPFPPVSVLPALPEPIRLKQDLPTIRIDSIRMDEEVVVKDGHAATSVASKLSVKNINAQLQKAGLPEAQVSSSPVSSSRVRRPPTSRRVRRQI